MKNRATSIKAENISATADNYPLEISKIRDRKYTASKLVFEKTLSQNPKYTTHLISYRSDDLKIYGILTLPQKTTKAPLVVFDRGFVDPAVYRSDKQYMRYLDYFAKSGFAVFKSDYRGIGQSEGTIDSVVSSANSADVLNGIASLVGISTKSLELSYSKLQTSNLKSQTPCLIDLNNVFFWGHSMGAMITLQCLLVPSSNIGGNPTFRGASLWAGFMIPYADILDRWLNSKMSRQRTRARSLIKTYGDPKSHLQSWQNISPFYFFDQLPCPIQLQHGLKDKIVPVDDSIKISTQLAKFGLDGGLITYPKADHDMGGPELKTAMAKTIKFFQKHLN